jgi:hypothetical protein
MDRREAILSRLVEIAGGLDGIVEARRNLPDVSEFRRPAIGIWDGEEIGAETDPTIRPANTPRRIEIRPEIFILVSADAADLGPTLNRFRAALVKAVLTDAPLIALTENGRGARYLGCASGLARGRKVEGEMTLRFAIPYILNPAEL